MHPCVVGPGAGGTSRGGGGGGGRGGRSSGAGSPGSIIQRSAVCAVLLVLSSSRMRRLVRTLCARASVSGGGRHGRAGAAPPLSGKLAAELGNAAIPRHIICGKETKRDHGELCSTRVCGHLFTRTQGPGQVVRRSCDEGCRMSGSGNCPLYRPDMVISPWFPHPHISIDRKRCIMLGDSNAGSLSCAFGMAFLLMAISLAAGSAPPEPLGFVLHWFAPFFSGSGYGSEVRPSQSLTCFCLSE